LLSGKFGQVILIGWMERLRSIKHMQNQLRVGQGLAAATDAFHLEIVATFAQTSSIHKNNWQTTDVSSLLDCIPSGAWNWRDNSAIMAEQFVEQTGFADIGAADDRGANAPAQNLPFVGSAQQLVH